MILLGSNRNIDVSIVKHAIEYESEWVSPPYMNGHMRMYTGLDVAIGFPNTISLQFLSSVMYTSNLQIIFLEW